MPSLLRTYDASMHEHSFKRVRRRTGWMPSKTPDMLTAYDREVNLCDCGEEREIKTHARAIWQKAAEERVEKVRLYDAKWRRMLRDFLKGRTGVDTDITLSYDSLLRRSGADWNELDPLIDSLLRDGVIEHCATYPKGARKMVFRTGIVSRLKKILGLDAAERERKEIDSFFDSWEYPSNLMAGPAGTIAAHLDLMKMVWQERGMAVVSSSGDREVIMKSLSNYLLLIESLRKIFTLYTEGETASFRELAVQVSGDSKGLESVRPYLKELLGDLKEYRIHEHSLLVFCKMPVSGEADGRVIDLRACADYVTLTAATAAAFRPISSSMKRLILIENLTPFEKLAKDSGSESDTGILFLSGYPPGHVREFAMNILGFSPVEGLIWCDLDPDGVEIALTAGKWFSGSSWRPLNMEAKFLATSRSKPLSSSDRQKLIRLQERRESATFHPLLSEMERLGVKVEQEAQGLILQEQEGFD